MSTAVRATAGDYGGVDSRFAWLMAATAFFTCFVVYGVQYSFGAFFKSIAGDLGAGRADTAGIFSVNMFVVNLCGIAAGYIGDRFGPRPLMITGAISVGLGLVLTSRINQLWIGYLTYGFGLGIGSGCCFIPMVALVSGWFERRRNAAIGLTVSGIGCGTLFVVPLVGVLIHHYGWRTSYLVLGIASSILLLVCATVIRRPPAPPLRTRPRMADVARTPAFVCFAWPGCCRMSASSSRSFICLISPRAAMSARWPRPVCWV